MYVSSFVRSAVRSGLVAGSAYWLWRRVRGPAELGPALSERQVQALLQRAAGVLRLPTSPDHAPEVLPDGAGLRCARSGQRYPFQDGVLDLLPEAPSLTLTQQALNSPFMAWAYDQTREAVMALAGLPSFAAEVAAAQRRLRVLPGDTVLDLCCGPGNFTVEWGKIAGPEGLVIGLDISPFMLERAAAEVRRWGLHNVLLVRGDALHLPLRSRSLGRINCSGGLHQLPDLQQALRELSRVSIPGAVLTASTFAQGAEDPLAAAKSWCERRLALRFVDLNAMEEQLERAGFVEYQQNLPGGLFGYLSARRAGSVSSMAPAGV